ncbi:hypothetical protein Tco_0861085 [Tanacetum coccineum]|uniref:Myb/SANT-like domain-containing protein n=1 Tax=Tanacetum coccineum TaxID=301880 RepID=A0ABQ5BKI4_9ASTR
MWNDLILAHEGPSDKRDTKIETLRLKFNAFKSPEGEKVNGNFTRLKCLLNNLKNNGVTIPQAEVNATFVNSLPRKWLSMNQTQRANNSIKNDSLATLYGKYNYEKGLIDQIYESETQRFTIHASSSKSLISNHQFQDNDSDVEEDQRTINEFMADLNAEYHKRALLANQKRFYKRSGRVGSARKPLDKTKETCFACGKLVPGNIVKALGGKGRRKEKISSKEVVFTKADESSSTLAPEITSDSESECDSEEPLSPLPKLIGVAPSGTSESLISLSDLTLNMADLTLDTPEPKKTRPSAKVSLTYVIKKKTEKSPAGPKPCSDKKTDSSTEKLLLTLME